MMHSHLFPINAPVWSVLSLLKNYVLIFMQTVAFHVETKAPRKNPLSIKCKTNQYLALLALNQIL